LESLARVLDHVPEPGQHFLRHWGFCTNAARGRRERRKRAERRTGWWPGHRSRRNREPPRGDRSDTPEVATFLQRRRRERLKKVTSPLATVSANAASSMNPTISTRPLPASCTTAGTSPSDFD